MKTGRRGFLKGLLGVAATPIVAKGKSKNDLVWNQSYYSGLNEETKDKLRDSLSPGDVFAFQNPHGSCFGPFAIVLLSRCGNKLSWEVARFQRLSPCRLLSRAEIKLFTPAEILVMRKIKSLEFFANNFGSFRRKLHGK